MTTKSIASLLLACIVAAVTVHPAAAFHVVIPNPPPGTAAGISNAIPQINWLCFQQPIIIGVNDVDGNTNLETAAHIGWMRITVRWSFVEPSQGSFDFSRYDSAVAAAQRNNIKILAVLSTAPTWAGGGPDGTIPPSNISLWQTFVQQTAAHYNGQIAAYEIWNEPNLTDKGVGVGWNHSLTAAPLYVDYLHAAAVAIRTNAPGTLVVGPALSSQPDSNGTLIFNQIETTTYSDGPGYNFMDAVSFHANASGSASPSSISSWITSHLNQIDGFNRGKPIWLTEFGWDSGSVGESGQESNIKTINEYLTGMLSNGGYNCLDYQWYKFTHAFIFDIEDSSTNMQGIFHSNGTPKVTVTAYTATLPTPARQLNADYSAMTWSCTGATCTFTNPWTSNQLTTQYGWDFGDGTLLYQVGGRVVTHTFPGAGAYLVATGAANTSDAEEQSDIEYVVVP